MSDRLIKVNKRIYHRQAGGNTVLIAYEDTLVKESVLKALGYDIAEVSDEPALKAVKPSDVQNKAVKPSTKTFKEDAKDGDGDGKVQDGTPHERPAKRTFKSKGE